MREAANIEALSGLKPDYMGLIFYPGSKRFVSDADISVLKTFPESIKITGVFVNEERDIVLQTVKQYHLKAVQLHGNESPEYCRSLGVALSPANIKIELIKAFGVDEDFDFNDLEAYSDVVDFFLFDTKTPAHGGSGVKFNWDVLKRYPFQKPYFLSGGIGPDDMNELMLINDERFYAADLNSKFEITPGMKDIDELRRAMATLRATL